MTIQYRFFTIPLKSSESQGDLPLCTGGEVAMMMPTWLPLWGVIYGKDRF